jgi:8-oxo-dGTP pyrophosphatase MutT (NUDIX family)
MNQNTFVQNFKSAIESGLPGEESHALLMPLNRPLTSSVLKSDVAYRDSAVGVILYPESNSIYCVLIKRQKYEGIHSAQISFPGGKMDENDKDLEFTARRECLEEINLPIQKGVLIGRLSPVYIPVSNFMVQPYIFMLNSLPTLIPNAKEVESIIKFDVFTLTNDGIIKKTDMQFSNGMKRKDIPYFDIQGQIVWGATAMMLRELKTILNRF